MRAMSQSHKIVALLLLGGLVSACAPKNLGTSTAASSWSVTEEGRLREEGLDGFSAQRVFASRLRAVQSVDFQHVWTVGDGGSVLHSSDGGRVFDPQQSGVKSHLRALSFSSLSHGLLVGDFGVVLSTDDGGARWRRMDVPRTDVSLRAVALSRGTAVIVGERGSLWVSHDGGRTFDATTPLTEETLVSVEWVDDIDYPRGAVIVTSEAGNAFFTVLSPPLMEE
jgi:photosystem II stability/assembly factor-like uncharacterized protein